MNCNRCNGRGEVRDGYRDPELDWITCPICKGKSVDMNESLRAGKIVRDNLPLEIARKHKIEVEKLDGERGHDALVAKLAEELEELADEIESGNHQGIAEELGDVVEVLVGIGELYGVDAKTIESIMDKKYEEKGGFYERYFVRVIDEETPTDS